MTQQKTTALALLLSILSFSAFAQLPKDAFPFSIEYKKGGYYISPLATISFGNKVEGVFERSENTQYEYETTGRGKWGYGLELGWYHTFEDSWIIDYVEGGLSYRLFSAAAEHKGSFLSNNTPVLSYESDNKIRVQTITAVARVVDAIHFEKKHHFITLGLGINYNYKFREKIERSRSYVDGYEEFLETHSAQLHFQLGYGFRLNKKVILIATAETPLLTGYPTGDLNPAFPFFSAKYQPLIIGLKFMRTREDPENCNAPKLLGLPSTN